MIVVDTNVIAHAVLGGSSADLATAALARDPAWAAPLLWRSEFCNMLAMQVRLRGLSSRGAGDMLKRAVSLVESRERPVDGGSVIELAARSGCTAYDCEFVWLALELAVPLVTNDRQVLAGFPTVAVSLTDFAGGFR